MNSLADSNSICNKCGKLATMMCQRCQELYCSADCQVLDWKEHKSTCHQMPNLVPMSKVLRYSASHNSILNDSTLSDGMRRPNNMRNSSQDVQQRKRPKACNPLPQSKSGDDTLPAPKTLVMSNESAAATQLLDDKYFTLKPKVRDPNAEVSKGAVLKGGGVSDKSQLLLEKIPAWAAPFLPPKGVFFDVIVQFKDVEEPDVIWVTEAKYDKPLGKLLTEINHRNTSLQPCQPEDVSLGALVAAPLEAIYYRAVVLETSANAQMATVRLIDYGNKLQVKFQQLRLPIPIMRNLNAYCIRVRMPPDCNAQSIDIESLLTIRVLGADKQFDGIYKVELKTKSLPLHLPHGLLVNGAAVTLKKVFIGGQHALVQLKLHNSEGLLGMHNTLTCTDGEIPILTVPATEGSFVAARTAKGWRRATVLGHCEANRMYLVYLIDEGIVDMCKQLANIPEGFLTAPIAVIAIQVTSPTNFLDKHELEHIDNLNLRLLATTQLSFNSTAKSLRCELLDNKQKLVTVVAHTFTGSLDALGIKCWSESITDGARVYITNVLTQAEVFISTTSTLEYPQIFSSLADKCDPYSDGEPITKDDIVLAGTGASGVYFRAKVLSSGANGSLIVLDIDTGLVCDVSRDAVRRPNLFVRSCPVYAQKVKLVNVEKIPIQLVDNKAVLTLMQCKENMTEFIVKHGNANQDVVDLMLATEDHQSLSKQLLPLIFEKCADAPNISDCSSTLTAAFNDCVIASNTPLPPSPPDTPVFKDAPLVVTDSEQISVSATEHEATNPAAVLPNLTTEAATEIFTMDDVTVMPITEGEDVTICVLDPSNISNGYITAADIKSSTKMATYLCALQKHLKCPHLERGYQPKPNEVCLALFAEDGDWYRALCMGELKNGLYYIMFLDYGNFCHLTKDDIMPIIKDLMYPSNANMCYVEGLPKPLTKQQIVNFSNATTNQKISCSVKRQEEDSYTIILKDLDKYLR